MKIDGFDKKILVFTVAAWNSKIGANTWSALLKDFPVENLAAVSIREEPPDSDVCSRYFTFSENRIIKSIYKRNIVTGYEAQPQNASTINSDLEEHNARYKKMAKTRIPFMRLAREAVWELGKWRIKEFNDFLDSFKPDIILYSMEGYIHFNKIVEYAIKRTGAKAVGYIWDDNFSFKKSKRPAYLFFCMLQRRSLKRLVRISRDFFAITDMTKREADECFGINCKVLTKPLNGKVNEISEDVSFPLKMIYTGNLYIGRDISLIKVSKAIEKINSDGEKIVLDIYTNSFLEEKVLAQIENKWCKVHPPITQSEVIQKQKNSDILLFLEAIDGRYAKAARLSFSTKITDYLSAAKCIFALGNQDTAPIDYFKTNNAAVTVTDNEEVYEKLNELVEDTELIKSFAENAKKCGIENHNQEKINALFKGTLEALFE